MYTSIVLVDEPVSTDMNHLVSYVIHDHRATRCRVDVPSRRITRVDVIYRLELLPILNRLGYLPWRPSTLGQLILPLLRRMIAAEPPSWLTAGVIHDDLYA